MSSWNKFLNSLPDDTESLSRRLIRWDPELKHCEFPREDTALTVKAKTSSSTSVFVFKNNLIKWLKLWCKADEIRREFKEEYNYWTGLIKKGKAHFHEVAFETDRACSRMHSQLAALRLDDF